jgi:hypothetical protein
MKISKKNRNPIVFFLKDVPLHQILETLKLRYQKW